MLICSHEWITAGIDDELTELMLPLYTNPLAKFLTSFQSQKAAALPYLTVKTNTFTLQFLKCGLCSYERNQAKIPVQ